jgi:hypothetical protein
LRLEIRIRLSAPRAFVIPTKRERRSRIATNDILGRLVAVAVDLALRT